MRFLAFHVSCRQSNSGTLPVTSMWERCSCSCSMLLASLERWEMERCSLSSFWFSLLRGIGFLVASVGRLFCCPLSSAPHYSALHFRPFNTHYPSSSLVDGWRESGLLSTCASGFFALFHSVRNSERLGVILFAVPASHAGDDIGAISAAHVDTDASEGHPWDGGAMRRQRWL